MSGRHAEHPAAGPSAFAAAQWLGVLGAGLVATASAIVGFTGRPLLGAHGPALGLAGATVCCLIGSRRVRHAAPLVSRLLAHLGRLIGAVAAAAAVAAFSPWPWVPAAFGVALAGASLGWRLGAAWGRAGIHALAGGSVAVTVSATTPLPLGALLAAAALAMVIAGRTPRAAALERIGAVVGALALAAPFGGAPGHWRVGDGTLARLGLRGDVLAAAAPVAGVLGGAALLVVAARHRSTVAAHVAIAGAVVNLAAASGWDGWSRLSATTWLCALFALAQVAVAAGRRDPFWRSTLRTPAVLSFAVGCVLTLQVLAGSIAWALVERDANVALGTAAVLLGAGMALTRVDEIGRTVSLVAAAALVALGVGVGSGSLTATAATALGIAIACLALPTAPAVTTWVLASCGVLVVPAQLVDGTIAADAVAVAALLLAGWAIGRRSTVVETLAVMGGAMVVGMASRPLADHVSPLVAAAVAAGLAGAAMVASRRAAAVIALAGPTATALVAITSVIGSVGARADRVERFAAGSTALATAAAAVTLTGLAGRWRGDRRMDHVVAAAVAVGAPACAIGAGVGADVVVAAATLAGIAIGGAAFCQPRFGVADSLALASLAAAAFFGGTGGESLLAWTAVVAGGVAIGLHGLCRLDLAMAVSGGAVSLIGAGGVAAELDGARWLSDRLHSIGLSDADIVAVVAVVVLAAGGMIAATLRPDTRSWGTWGPASALATAYLLASIAENGRPDTRLLVVLTVSIGLAAAGAVRRAAAPLIIGTVATIGAVTLASWTTLTSLPAWTWIAAGGVALLTVAALVERRGRDAGDGDEVAADHVVRKVLTTFH